MHDEPINDATTSETTPLTGAQAVAQWPWLREGLNQIPTDGLERLRVQLLDPKSPLLFTGRIVYDQAY